MDQDHQRGIRAHSSGAKIIGITKTTIASVAKTSIKVCAWVLQIPIMSRLAPLSDELKKDQGGRVYNNQIEALPTVTEVVQ